MQYSHETGWSYSKYDEHQIVTVTNSDGQDRILNSITLNNIASGKGYANWGDAVTGDGNAFTMYLYFTYNGVTYTSTTESVNNTATNYQGSGGWTYRTNMGASVTFTFNDRPTIGNGASISVNYRKSRNAAVLVTNKSASGSDSEAYSPPSYSINSIAPQIGTIGSTSFTVNYSINGGTNPIDWTIARVYNSGGSHVQDFNLNNTSKGTMNGSFTLNSSNFSDGAMYSVSIRFSDCRQELETGRINIYTYRTPKISSAYLSPSTFSGTGNASVGWSTNARRWGSNPSESAFTTSLKFSSDNTYFSSSNNNNVGPESSNTMTSQSQSLSQSIITSHFTAEQRSQATQSGTLTIKRTNPSNGVTATSACSYTIQFHPKYAPSNIVYINPLNNESISKGSIVYIDECPNIKINWSYTDAADRGIITGYKVRIYGDSSRTSLISSYTTSSNTITVPIRTALKRGTTNYITIVAYYTKPNNTGDVEGPALNEMFVFPLGKLKKPVIDYPINNSIWHNDKFRVLLQSPEDDDYDSYDTATINSYVYKNVEIDINGLTIASFANTDDMTANSVVFSAIFSTATLSYKKKLCINPSLYNAFVSSSTYRIKIRFQKNYYKPIWSEWSNTIIITKQVINELSLAVQDIILNSHYNTVRNSNVRIYNVYPMFTLPQLNVTKNAGDIILKDNYNAIYQTILSIQQSVNNYALVDANRESVKFIQVIDKLSGNNAVKQELITAAKDPRPLKDGRNYMNILVECMNKLY